MLKPNKNLFRKEIWSSKYFFAFIYWSFKWNWKIWRVFFRIFIFLL